MQGGEVSPMHNYKMGPGGSEKKINKREGWGCQKNFLSAPLTPYSFLWNSAT